MKTPGKSKIKSLVNFDRKHGNLVIGADEAGRGPVAGPVTAAAVFFPEFTGEILETIQFIDDSKKLTPALRIELAAQIKQVAKYSIAECSVEEIAKYNILQASLLAMKRACEGVFAQIDAKDAVILVDGKFVIPRYKLGQKAVKKGDSLSASIAAASILAKTDRDKFMEKISEEFPAYDWHKNKGYGTEKHIEAIKAHGQCKWHRKSFLSKIYAQQQKLIP